MDESSWFDHSVEDLYERADLDDDFEGFDPDHFSDDD